MKNLRANRKENVIHILWLPGSHVKLQDKSVFSEENWKNAVQSIIDLTTVV